MMEIKKFVIKSKVQDGNSATEEFFKYNIVMKFGDPVNKHFSKICLWVFVNPETGLYFIVGDRLYHELKDICDKDSNVKVYKSLKQAFESNEELDIQAQTLNRDSIDDLINGMMWDKCFSLSINLNEYFSNLIIKNLEQLEIIVRDTTNENEILNDDFQLELEILSSFGDKSRMASDPSQLQKEINDLQREINKQNQAGGNNTHVINHQQRRVITHKIIQNFTVKSQAADKNKNT
eukprot:403370385